KQETDYEKYKKLFHTEKFQEKFNNGKIVHNDLKSLNTRDRTQFYKYLVRYHRAKEEKNEPKMLRALETLIKIPKISLNIARQLILLYEKRGEIQKALLRTTLTIHNLSSNDDDIFEFDAAAIRLTEIQGWKQGIAAYGNTLIE